MFSLSPAEPKARDGRYCNAPRPSICLSIRPSVTFSSRTVTRKRIRCIFSRLCMYVHHVMGVCCMGFDIDGMLFEVCMIFLNIKKNYKQNLNLFHVFLKKTTSFSFHFLGEILRSSPSLTG